MAESKQPGIGLGLATVKKIVEAYGGRVGVRSPAPEGSTFWFELPEAQPVHRETPVMPSLVTAQNGRAQTPPS